MDSVTLSSDELDSDMERVLSPEVVDDESLEQLLQRADDQLRIFLESRASSATTGEGNSHNSIMNGFMRPYVATTSNEAQETLFLPILVPSAAIPTITIPVDDKTFKLNKKCPLYNEVLKRKDIHPVYI